MTYIPCIGPRNRWLISFARAPKGPNVSLAQRITLLLLCSGTRILICSIGPFFPYFLILTTDVGSIARCCLPASFSFFSSCSKRSLRSRSKSTWERTLALLICLLSVLLFFWAVANCRTVSSAIAFSANANVVEVTRRQQMRLASWSLGKCF